MSLTTLAVALLVSLIGPLVAGLLALVPHQRSYQMSNLVLGGSACVGAFVGVAIAIGQGNVSLQLPTALYDGQLVEIERPTWPLFFGMIFTLDRFSAIFYTLVNAVTALTTIFAIPHLTAHSTIYNVRGVSALTSLLIFGMLGVILSTSIVGFMAFWEIIMISTFFLVVADGSEESRHAGFLYLVMAHLGAGAIMAGLFLLSGGALLSDFSLLAFITAQLSQGAINAALALLLLGFGGQAGLVPLHVWLPEAHSQAPSHVSALMSGVMVKIAIYGLLRILLFAAPTVPMWFVVTMIILGLVSAVVGVLYAVLERDMKRMFAYTTIETVGIVFAALGVGLLASQQGSIQLTQAALYAALLLMISHAFLKSGLFMAAGAIIAVVRTQNVEAMGGLSQRMPQFSVAVCVLACAAALLPPFGPFVAEWMLVQSMVSELLAATAVLKVVMIIGLAALGFVAGMKLFAMMKFYGITFLALPRSDEAAQATEPGIGYLIPVVSTAFIGLLLGLFSPTILSRLGALDLVREYQNPRVITTGGEVFIPVEFFLLFGGIMGFLLLARRVLTDVHLERIYHTWDGGQPVTSRTEITATAFSAPVRFFFRFFLRAQKAIEVTPLLAANPWVSTRTMRLEVRQAWYDYLYAPALWTLQNVAMVARRLQNGNIQFYLSLILLTLLVTLIIAL